MNTKTDNAAHVGMHAFEKAGLGAAPFKFVGCYEDRGPKVIGHQGGCTITVGSPGQPMGTCKYCGQGILVCCVIRSSDGKEFTVGSDCVARTGDAGILKGYKTHPDVRKLLAALEPLRRLWKNSVGTNRLALEVVVLNYLRTGQR